MVGRFYLSSIDSLREIQDEKIFRFANLFSDRQYLLFMEEMRRDAGVWYMVVIDNVDDSIVGLLPIYEGGASATSYWDPFSHYLSRALDEECTGFRDTRFLGIRSGYGWQPLISENLSLSDSTVVWELMFNSLKFPFSGMFISEQGYRRLLALGLTKDDFFLAGAASWINTSDFNSFDDYLRVVKSPKQVRREMRVFAESDAFVRILPLAEVYSDLSWLCVQHGAKYGLELSAKEEEEEMARLIHYYGDSAIASVAVRRGEVIGGAVCLKHNGTLYVRQGGFDYKQSGGAFEYFNLGYYELVRYAMREGITSIDYGQATYRAKIFRGARVEPLWGFAFDDYGQSIMRMEQFRSWDNVRKQLFFSEKIDSIEKADFP